MSGNLLWQVLRVTSKKSIQRKVVEEIDEIKDFSFRLFRDSYAIESVREDRSPYVVVAIIAKNCIPETFCPNLEPLERIKGWYYQQEEALYVPKKDVQLKESVLIEDTHIPTIVRLNNTPTFNGASL